VPPPPVAGAAAGAGRGEGCEDLWCVWWGDAAGDPLSLVEGVAEGLVLLLLEGVALPLGKIAAVGGRVPAGENEEGPAAGVDPEQADSAPEASTVIVPQPMRASLARRPGRVRGPGRVPGRGPVLPVAVRTFMEPPRAPGRRWSPKTP
jgi:hypothetical protein